MSGILDDFKDAFSKRNNGLIQLIWLNVAIYIFTLLLFVTFTLFFKGGNLYYTLLSYVSLSPEPTTLLFRPWTFLTYSFLHHINPIVHIFPNMLMLYWFGSILQEYIGSRRLVGLYIVGAIFGAVLAVLAFNFIPYYHQNIASTSIIGASGSVMAVVFAAATLAPDYSFFLFLIGSVRIKYIAFLLLIISLAGSIGANAGGEIVHLGGAIFGYIYIRQLRAGRDFSTPIEAVIEFFEKLFKRKNEPKIRVAYRQKEASYSSTASSHSGFPDEEEVDEILDKISRSGYESLTKEEKQKLFKASQK